MSTSPAKPDETLMLYMDELCGYCHMVRTVMQRLDLDVEMRDIRANRDWAKELHEARGRMTVPVLRRVNAEGESEWMPESSDIIAYLQEAYA